MPLRNEKGIALVTTLLLMAFGVGLSALVAYSLATSLKMSGNRLDYQRALQAAKAGEEAVKAMVLFEESAPDAIFSSSNVWDAGCLEDKLNHSSNHWSACGEPSKSPDATEAPDITFVQGPYNVRVKIIDTRQTSTHYYYTILSRAESPRGNTAEVLFVYRLEL
jgi:hypothetical protein